MPLIKSAQKKMRKDLTRKGRNKNKKASVHKAILGLTKAVQKKEKFEVLTKLFRLVQQKIDKAAKLNLITKNTGARRKSRLAKLIKGS